MKQWLWRLLGKRFWCALATRWKDKHGQQYYAEWEQKKGKVRDYHYWFLAKGGSQQVR